MREIQTHKVNEANSLLTIRAVDGPGPGGASHAYIIGGIGNYMSNPSAQIGYDEWKKAEGTSCAFVFQNGAIGEKGVNGVTHEALLAVLTDRLAAFQTGPYSCKENAEALHHLLVAATWLNARTKRRTEAGVEGTMAFDDNAERGEPLPNKKNSMGNPIMRYFAYGHLPAGPLRDTSQLVGDLAKILEEKVPTNAEKSAGLRKLLEAKDCFVRAMLQPV